jgi:hypothetical protein
MAMSADTETVEKKTGGVEATQQDVKRVTVVFAPQTYAKIAYIADHKGTNKTEALRQSIFLTEYLVKAAEEGAKVFIDRNGKLSELVL